MDREKSLIKNTVIISIGKICTNLITFFLLPIYTKVLTTEEFGIHDLLNTLVMLFLPILTLQIEQALYRYLIDCRDDDIRKTEIISNTLAGTTLQLGVFVIIFMVLYPLIQNEYKIYLVLNLIVYSFALIFLQISRGLGENEIYSLASFFCAFTTIVLNLVFLLGIKWRVEGLLIASFLGQLSCCVVVFLKTKTYKYIDLKVLNKNTYMKLLKYSIPLIPNALAWWFFNASDRVIVTGILGVNTNGLLAAASKIPGVYITIYMFFNVSWTESVSLHIKDKDVECFFNSTVKIVFDLFVAFTNGLISIMPYTYNWIINEKFNGGYGLLPILLIASFFNVIVGLVSVVYVAEKDTKAIAKTSIFAALINVIVHLGLIKYIGVYAAAISTLVAFLVMSIYRVCDISKKYININLFKNFNFINVIWMCFVTIAFYINNYYLNIISLVVSIIISILTNINILKIVLKWIEEKRGKYAKK